MRVAHLRGVPVFIGRSWVIVALFVVAAFGPSVSRSHPEWGMGAYLVAAAYALLLLVSVLAHEASHAITAQLVGFKVNRIVADLWGGHTAYDTEAATPGRSALVALVGPVSNAVLAAVGFAATQYVAPGGAAELLLYAFAWSNGFVALFNALPGLPLDGGFVVDALVWKFTGSRAKGLKAAGWCGRIVAVGVLGWALLDAARFGAAGALWTIIWCGAIAWFLWRGASTAVTVGANREFLSAIRVGDVVDPVSVVAMGTPLGSVPDTGTIAVLIDPTGRPVATLAPDAHLQVPIERRATVPAESVSHALPPALVLHVDGPDNDIMTILDPFASPLPPAFVVITTTTPQGEVVVGVVTQGRLERALSNHAQRLKSSS